MRAAGNDTTTLPEDPAALRALLLETQALCDTLSAERDVLASRNERLQHLLLKLRRRQFGRKSEQLPEDQLLFAFEEIEATLVGYWREAKEPLTVGRTVRPGDAVGMVEALGIVTDVTMVQTGLKRELLEQLGIDTWCGVHDRETHLMAQQYGITRSAAGIRRSPPIGTPAASARPGCRTMPPPSPSGVRTSTSPGPPCRRIPARLSRWRSIGHVGCRRRAA